MSESKRQPDNSPDQSGRIVVIGTKRGSRVLDVDTFAAVLWQFLPGELGSDDDAGPSQEVQDAIADAIREAIEQTPESEHA